MTRSAPPQLPENILLATKFSKKGIYLVTQTHLLALSTAYGFYYIEDEPRGANCGSKSLRVRFKAGKEVVLRMSV